MKFTDVMPTDWRDLQNQTARYFRESGYEAKTPCKIKTARGEVEVDVYVEAPLELCKLVLCECKYWDGNIPQEKIHAFRTVVSDSGASLGIVIAKNGFQKGSYEAAQYSNVQLKTWNEFLEMVRIRWITYQLRALKKKRSPLAFYLNPMNAPIENLSREKRKDYTLAMDEFSSINTVVFLLTVKDLTVSTEYHFPTFDCTTIEQYIKFLLERTEKAIQIFEEIFAGVQIDSDKLIKSDLILYMNF